MNYYERIQCSLDYIEANLDGEITIEGCAKQACMSLSGYYRIFLSIVGYNVKEYIRLRRLTCALIELYEEKDVGIIDLAVKYAYNSADSFTRAFKNQFGILPSKVKAVPRTQIMNEFGRRNIMEEVFESENVELLEKYPDIKVIRGLQDMKVACYTHFGPDPEEHAFEKIREWMLAHQTTLQKSGYRIFGYNNPDPQDPANDKEIYGYEVCVTIPDDLFEQLEDAPQLPQRKTYDGVKRRTLAGGKYAVLSVKRDAEGDIGRNIMYAWKRFSKWLEEGKYIWGGRQYLEEHLEFTDDMEHVGGVDLYMPVEVAPKLKPSMMKETQISKCRVALFHVEAEDGEKALHECWEHAATWAKKNGLSSEQCRIFAYNRGFDRSLAFFYTIMITLPEDFNEAACPFKGEATFTEFMGGKYMSVESNYEEITTIWGMLDQWRIQTKTEVGHHQWVEQWVIQNWAFPSQKIIAYYPI